MSSVTTSTGLYSGINTDQLIQDLLAVELQPINGLQQKESTYQAQISSYGTIKSTLSTLQDTLANLKSSALSAFAASSSDTSALTATATSSATSGTYNISIANLATAQSIYSPTFASESAAVADLSTNATQKLLLQVGSNDPATITVDSSNNTLSGIRDAINNAGVGVSASIVNSGFVVDNTNNTIVFNDGSNHTATLTAGTYTADGLAAELKRALEAANSGNDTYSVSYDTGTNSFTVTNDSTNSNSIDLAFEDPSTTAASLLGFSSTDHAAIAVGSNMTGDNGVGGYRLVLTGSDTGSSGRISVKVDENNDGAYEQGAAETDTTGLSQLAFNPTYDSTGSVTGGTANMTQSTAAVDAAFTVNGLSVSRSSNTVSDLINGVTLNLLNSTGGGSLTLTVSNDTNTVINNVNSFINAYNSANQLVRSLTVPQNGQGVLFTGDATTNSIMEALRTATITSYAGQNLAVLGFSHQQDATLTLNQGVLQSAMDNNLQGVIDTLDSMASSLDTTLGNYVDTAIPTRTDGLNQSIDNINQQIQGIQDRAATDQANLEAQFSAMETLLGQYQQDSNVLTQLLGQSTSSNTSLTNTLSSVTGGSTTTGG
jgi:flagellar hook-associated protein 2